MILHLREEPCPECVACSDLAFRWGRCSTCLYIIKWQDHQGEIYRAGKVGEEAIAEYFAQWTVHLEADRLKAYQLPRYRIERWNRNHGPRWLPVPGDWTKGKGVPALFDQGPGIFFETEDFETAQTALNRRARTEGWAPIEIWGDRPIEAVKPESIIWL